MVFLRFYLLRSDQFPSVVSTAYFGISVFNFGMDCAFLVTFTVLFRRFRLFYLKTTRQQDSLQMKRMHCVVRTTVIALCLLFLANAFIYGVAKPYAFFQFWDIKQDDPSFDQTDSFYYDLLVST